MRVVVRAETFRVSDWGSVTGVIYLDSRGWMFPVMGWRDFVDVLLRSWSVNVLKLLTGDVEQAELMFMDGPNSVSLICCRNVGKAMFLHDGETVNVADFDAVGFVRSLVAANKMLIDCEAFKSRLPKKVLAQTSALNALTNWLHGPRGFDVGIDPDC